MILYDNDSYFEEFRDSVYDLLADDPDWNRVNQIINLYLNSPAIDISLLSNGETK